MGKFVHLCLSGLRQKLPDSGWWIDALQSLGNQKEGGKSFEAELPSATPPSPDSFNPSTRWPSHLFLLVRESTYHSDSTDDADLILSKPFLNEYPQLPRINAYIPPSSTPQSHHFPPVALEHPQTVLFYLEQD